MNPAQCLRLAGGAYTLVFIFLILLLSKSITSKSLRSLLNLPPKTYILLSYTAEECPHLVRIEKFLSFFYFHSKLSNFPVFRSGVKSRL